MGNKLNLSLYFLVLFATPVIISGKYTEKGFKAWQQVGTADGKTFYLDFSNSMTWQEAKEVCISEGYKLATITTKAQLDVLQNATLNLPWRRSFWTAGREARLPQGYVWDDTEEVVSSDIGIEFLNTDSGLAYRSCLAWHITAFGESNLDYRHCENAHNPLCETA